MIYGIQKDGELTNLTKTIYKQVFNLEIPDFNKTLVIKNGQNTIVWTRNKSLIPLLLSRSIDYAVVGTDQLAEQSALKKLRILKRYTEYKWPLVLASKPRVSNIGTIATQYPMLAKNYFKDKNIIKTQGGTEAYPYLKVNNQSVDAIFDISITGDSLKRNNLVKLKTICYVYPVLVTIL